MSSMWVSKLEQAIHATREDTKAMLGEEPNVKVVKLCSVYKRSNKGINTAMLIGVCEKEANFWAAALNSREINKRREERNAAYARGLEYRPDEVFFYDTVEIGTREADLFYNPSELFCA